MNYYLKSRLKNISSSNQRKAIRRFKRHFLSKVSPRRKISLKEMRSIIEDDLGIKKGDRIIVSSSFGNLNANFSPQELMDTLMDIIGKDGVIMMPYYPPINSTEWAARHEVFDMRNTKSGMGILTNVFSKMPDVYMSKHPTKAVCVWGKNAEYIASDHDKATTPFYWDSPYGKYFKIHSKSVGLGVTHIPIFHAIEDILSSSYDFFYQKNVFTLKVIDKNGDCTNVDTLVHEDNILNRCVNPRDFVPTLNCKSYKKIDVGYGFAYTINNDELFKTCEDCFEKGYTRLKK